MITYGDIRGALAPKYEFTNDEDLSLRLIVQLEENVLEGSDWY